MEGASLRTRLLCCPAASLGGERRNVLLIQSVAMAPLLPCQGCGPGSILQNFLGRSPISCSDSPFCVSVMCWSFFVSLNPQEDALRQVLSRPFCRWRNQGFQTDSPCVTWLLKVEFGLELRSDAKASSSTGAATFLICPPYGYLLFKFSTRRGEISEWGINDLS